MARSANHLTIPSYVTGAAREVSLLRELVHIIDPRMSDRCACQAEDNGKPVSQYFHFQLSYTVDQVPL